jgi:hypothetical protein
VPGNGIAVAHGPHVVQAGEQEGGAYALPAGRVQHADGTDEAARGGVVAAEALEVVALLGDEEGDGAVGEGGGGFGGPGREKIGFDPPGQNRELGADGLSNCARRPTSSFSQRGE